MLLLVLLLPSPEMVIRFSIDTVQLFFDTVLEGDQEAFAGQNFRGKAKLLLFFWTQICPMRYLIRYPAKPSIYNNKKGGLLK